MILHPGLVSTEKEIREIADKLRNQDVVAFDTEFIRETTFFPTLEILQIASLEDSWIIDIQPFRGENNKHGLAALFEIFADPKILKVVHAAQSDQECLATAFGIVATPIVDTAIAGSLCGHGDSPGLAALLKNVLNIKIKKGHSRTNWAVRPLPNHQMEYAHEDVRFLVELWKALDQELTRLGRKAWAMELSSKFENIALYESNPVELANKLFKGGKVDKKNYPVLIKLIEWRERRVRELNIPRRWLADDSVLMDIANVKPKDVDHLGSFRGLNKGEIRKSGEHIIALIKEAVAQAADSKIKPPESRQRHHEIPTVDESRALSLFQCYLGLLADERQISSKHLIPSARLLPLLRAFGKSVQTVEDLWQKEFLAIAAAELIGQEILDFLAGKTSMGILDGRVRIGVEPKR